MLSPRRRNNMKLLKESEINVFEELRTLREKLGDSIVLDEMKEELSYTELEEFVNYLKRRYKKSLEED